MNLLGILHDIGTDFLGDMSIGRFISTMIFAGIGGTLSLTMYSIATRDKCSPRTPYKWSFLFMIGDNIQRVIGGVTLVFVFVRFAPDLIGLKATPLTGLIIGISFDNLGEILRRFRVIDKKGPITLPPLPEEKV
jgi:hypothetical protein